MKFIIKIILTILCVNLSVSVYSQNYRHSTIGKEFWVSFLENIQGANTVLYITSNVINSGTVNVPGTSWSRSFSIPANGSIAILIPTYVGVEISQANVILDKAVKVVSEHPISVYAANQNSSSSDASLVLPVNILGDSYIITSYKGVYDNPSEFVIVGTQDNTTVEIVPSADLIGGVSANTPFNITINQGQVYLIKSLRDLTGSLVRSVNVGGCNNFAVFAGVKCTNIPLNKCCCDHLYEQMLPVKSFGMNYITSPLQTRLNGDLFRIVASENETLLRINNTINANLNKGEFYDIVLENASSIVANKPISVAQYSHSSQYDGVVSDPFMIMLSPVEQAIDSIVFQAFNTPDIEDFYINVIAKTVYTNTVLLNGLPLSDWQVVPSKPLYSYTSKRISRGTYRINSPYGALTTVYGFGTIESYGYLGGANMRPLNVSYDFIIDEDTIAYDVFSAELGCMQNNVEVQANVQNVSNIEWNFGDGSPIVAGNSANHIYQDVGTYTVTMSFLIECTQIRDSISTTIGIVSNISQISFPDTVVCNNTSFTFNGNSNYNYLWHDGSRSHNYVFTSSGNYYVIITDSVGCIFSHNSRIDFVNLNLDAIVQVPCNNEPNGYIRIEPDGTSQVFDYIWNTDPPQSSQTINNLGEGIFIVTVTDTYGCSETLNLVLENSPPFIVETNFLQNIKCFGTNDGKARINIVGETSPYSILWEVDGISGFEPDNLYSGINTFTVTDANNCSKEGLVNLTSPSKLNISSSINHVKCKDFSDGAINVVIQGGTNPYNIVWSNNSTNASITNLSKGNYTITVTDLYNCQHIETYEVMEPLNNLSLEVLKQNINCYSSNSGSVSLLAKGGTPPYVYKLYNEEQTFNFSIINNLYAGRYNALVKDKNSCVENMQIEISQPLKLSASYNIVNPTCLGNNNGVIEFYVNGGTKPYIYYIGNNIVSDTSFNSNLYQGSYMVEIIDANLCKESLGIIKLTDDFKECIKVNNAFTPNGDGTNDVWIVEGIEEFPEAKIQIFNRWGQEVFNSKESKKMNWDGKFSGKLVPTGTYMYVISLGEDIRDHSEFKGILTVIY